MSKGLSHLYGNNSKQNPKLSNFLRSSQGKLTIDPNKYDFKSPNHNIMTENKIFSPTHVGDKKAYFYTRTKSPQDQKLTIGHHEHSTDHHVKDFVKNFPQTTKNSAKSSYSLVSNNDKHISNSHLQSKKFIAANDKLLSQKAKDESLTKSSSKNLHQNYTSIMNKKSIKDKDLHKSSASDFALNIKHNNNSNHNINNSKPKIMEEPPKKASMPSATIGMALNNLYSGSHSHRAPINSGADIQSSNIVSKVQSTNPPPPTHRRKSDVDVEQTQSVQSQFPVKHGSQQSLNNFLVDMVQINQEHVKNSKKLSPNHRAVNSSSTNHNNNNTHHTNNPNNSSSSLDHGKQMSGGSSTQLPSKSDPHYNELLNILNEKNLEIQKLNSDKNGLQETLECLSNEITDLKKLKKKGQDSDKSTQHEILRNDPKDLKKELQKENILLTSGENLDEVTIEDPTRTVESQQLDKRILSKHRGSMQDDSSSTRVSEQQQRIEITTGGHNKVMTKSSSSSHAKPTTAHNGNKRPDSSQHYSPKQSQELLSTKHDFHSTGGNSNGNVMNIYQRNYSSTLEEASLYTKKATQNESPYYDAIKSIKNGNLTTKNSSTNISGSFSKKGNQSLLSKKTTTHVPPTSKISGGYATSHAHPSKPMTAAHPNKYSLVPGHPHPTHKKENSASSSPRKLEISTGVDSTIDRPKYMGHSSTTTNAEFDLAKRKFSHDVKFHQAATNDLISPQEKKVHNNSNASINRKKARPYEGLDIGKALGGLKDRIRLLLDKHKDGYNKLKLTHDLYLKQLEILSNNGSSGPQSQQAIPEANKKGQQAN